MNTQVRKSAIVTGASRGIGQAIAQRLAADGFAVVVNYAGSETAAHETVEAIRAAGGTALAVRADVGSADDVRELFATAKRNFGRIDLVVANGGVMRTAPIASMSPDDFDSMITVNLRGTFLAMAEAAKHLERGGRFVALSSNVIAKHTPGYGPYIASKAGVEGLVQVFAQEMRGRDISVNAVAPGARRHRVVPEGQERRADLADRQAGAAGAHRPARGHRQRGVLPGGAGWRLGQRAGPARQRRLRLISEGASS